MNDIVIIDYGVGNIASIGNMLKRIGSKVDFSDDPERIAGAAKLILPGVGSFDHAASRLHETGFADLIRERRDASVPILGVCLGMQLLLDGSDEGTLPGLGLVPGRSHRFPSEFGGTRLRVPHMGWNTVQLMNKEMTAFPSIESKDRFYFVHSYYVLPDSDEHILATSQHGIEFASMIGHENVYGVQFHPEKSHRYGMRLLNDFVMLAASPNVDSSEK